MNVFAKLLASQTPVTTLKKRLTKRGRLSRGYASGSGWNGLGRF